MDTKDLRDRVAAVSQKRAFLVELSTNPRIGDLAVDVSQALLEMDDLLAEFANTFPEEPLN
jgi:hypothetical protein